MNEDIYEETFMIETKMRDVDRIGGGKKVCAVAQDRKRKSMQNETNEFEIIYLRNETLYIANVFYRRFKRRVNLA